MRLRRVSKEGGSRGCILLITSLWYFSQMRGMGLPQLPKLLPYFSIQQLAHCQKAECGNGEAPGGAFGLWQPTLGRSGDSESRASPLKSRGRRSFYRHLHLIYALSLIRPYNCLCVLFPDSLCLQNYRDLGFELETRELGSMLFCKLQRINI